MTLRDLSRIIRQTTPGDIAGCGLVILAALMAGVV
jgi:hypothetical protein